MPTTKLRYFWIKSDGRVQELSWEQYKELCLKDLGNPKYRKLLAICSKKYITLIKGTNVITIPTKTLDQIVTSISLSNSAMDNPMAH